MDGFRGPARYRQAATEFKLKAEQATSISKREYYFDLHRQYLRLAIACEEESEAAWLELGHAQNLILHSDKGVSLHEFIETHRAAFNVAARISVDGEPVVVNPHFGLQIGMALHELATNSVKYGAFGSDGRVEINWTITANNAKRRPLILNWVEVHDRENAPGEHRGFGHLLLTQIVPANLNGTASLVGSEGNLRWTLRRLRMVDIAAQARCRERQYVSTG
jgi:two-component sensor histidine kinase